MDSTFSFTSWAFVSANREEAAVRLFCFCVFLSIYSIYSRYCLALFLLRFALLWQPEGTEIQPSCVSKVNDLILRLGWESRRIRRKWNKIALSCFLCQLPLFPWAACLDPAAAQYFHLYLVYYHMIFVTWGSSIWSIRCFLENVSLVKKCCTHNIVVFQ